jgi:proline iminopeptidase
LRAQSEDDAMPLLPMQRLDDPFFPIEPVRAEGHLERDGGHAIFWQDASAEANMPVIVIHGGPGSLQATLGDIEALREHFRIDKWMVSGSSWGSTVAIAYAEAFPNRCLGINLTCLWLCRREDVHWWFHGVRTMFPELWESFASLVSPEERGDLRAAYVRRILGNDAELAKQAGERLYLYEQGFMQFDAPVIAPEAAAKGEAYGRVFAHYAANWFFVRDNQLLEDAHRIAHLPIEIVTGRYDCCTPPSNSYDFRAALPNAYLTIVPGGGHFPTEVAMAPEVARAPGRLYERIVAGGGWQVRC